MQRDNEYYLTHNFYGEEDNHGQVFLDERNSPDLSDDNTILYGHNITSDRSMFNVLTNFRDRNLWRKTRSSRSTPSTRNTSMP